MASSSSFLTTFWEYLFDYTLSRWAVGNGKRQHMGEVGHTKDARHAHCSRLVCCCILKTVIASNFDHSRHKETSLSCIKTRASQHCQLLCFLNIALCTCGFGGHLHFTAQNPPCCPDTVQKTTAAGENVVICCMQELVFDSQLNEVVAKEKLGLRVNLVRQ